MAYNPDVIESGECTNNNIIAGYPTRAMFIKDCDVTAVPERKTTDEAPSDKCAMTGKFVFKDTRRPTFIDAIEQTPHYAAATQGETGSESFAPTFEFATKDKVEADAFAADVLNQPGYMVFQEYDGRQMMVGNKLLKCKVIANFDSGTAVTDAKRYSFTVSVAAAFTPKQYLVTPINMEAPEGETPYDPYPAEG